MKNNSFSEKEHSVLIDPSQRNRLLHPSSSNFVVKIDPSNDYIGAILPRKYKNVKSIELVSAIYPNKNYALNQPYLVLSIDELTNGRKLDSTNNLNGFILTPRTVTTTYLYSYIDEEPSKIFFDFKGKTIEQFTIKILKSDGTIFSFGNDTQPPNDIDSGLQVVLKFKIITIEPSNPCMNFPII